MAEKITKIASTYDMVDIMRDIGANYFGSDLSEQRIGMFGYLTESAANMFGAAILDASNRQQEYNTCTAKKRSTLLYDGAKLNINIDNATPSKMTAYVGVLTNAITNRPSEGGFGVSPTGTEMDKDRLLVIEKDTVINIANYDFMFEYDIQIRATYSESTGSYSYSVRYLFEGDKDVTSTYNNEHYIIPRYTTAYSVDNKYIQSYVQNYSKDISILLFKIDLVQITKESTIYPIVKNDIISLTGIDFPFSNELSHFNIFYRKNGNSSWSNIMTVPIYQSDEIYDEDVIFYETLHDEKKIRLTMSDFTPAYNSELLIDIYTTLGSEVNELTYTGNGSDIYIKLNTFEERHSYTGLELNCKPISGAYGGTNTPTLEELRAKVINAKSTVNSFTTNYDLINFMKSRDTTNDFVFIKKRNDAIERRYSCYMIPRLVSKDIIPTSTLDLCIPLDIGEDINGISKSIDNNGTVVNLSVKSGVPLLLKKDIVNNSGDEDTSFDITKSIYSYPMLSITDFYNSNSYSEKGKEFNKDNSLMILDINEKYTSNGNIIDKYTIDKNGGLYWTKNSKYLENSMKVYTLPYTMVYNTKNQITSFYLTSISKDINMNMIEENKNSNVNFSIDTIHIERNSVLENDSVYKISVTIMTNGDISNAKLEKEENGIKVIKTNIDDTANTIMLKGFIYNNDNSLVGYFNLDYDTSVSHSTEDMFTFKGEVRIDDSVSYEYFTNMKNMYSIDELNCDEINTDLDKINDNYYIANNINPNKNFLNLRLENLRLGIGCYYLNRSINMKDVKSIQKVTVSPIIDINKKILSSPIDDSGNISYPQFVAKSFYNTNDNYTIDNYILTNVYDNSIDLLDLYTDMSKFVKSSTHINELKPYSNDVVYNMDEDDNIKTVTIHCKEYSDVYIITENDVYFDKDENGRITLSRQRVPVIKHDVVIIPDDVYYIKNPDVIYDGEDWSYIGNDQNIYPIKIEAEKIICSKNLDTIISNTHGQYSDIPNDISMDGDLILNDKITKIEITNDSDGAYINGNIVLNSNIKSITSDAYFGSIIIPSNVEEATILSPYYNGSIYVYNTYFDFLESEIGTKNIDNDANVLSIYGYKNSTAETYANTHGHIFKDIEEFGISYIQKLIHFTDVPVIQHSHTLSDTMSNYISNIISDSNENLTDLSDVIKNNFGVDYKFFRTYGPCRYFKLRCMNTDGTYEDIPLADLDISLRFSLLIKSNLNISDNDVVSQLKTYIKSRIEELNTETDMDDYTIYISNIITDIENVYNDYVRSIELVSINGNDSSYRTIVYDKPDFENLVYHNKNISNEDIREYVPEYINVPLNNITIDVRR